MVNPNPTQQQTLQQKRAAHAWARVESIVSRPEDFRKKYGSQVRGLPSLIQSDGLGQTLAFLKAKDKDKRDSYYFSAYNHIDSWTQDKDSGLNVQGDLLKWLLEQSSTDYRRATAEVLAYLSWLKRFAEAKGWQQDEGADR
jgi:CRISPR-associated protein Cmr5